MRVTVESDGFEDWARSTVEGIEALEEGAREGLALVALDMLAKAIQLAPLDTGKLRGSGYADVDGKKVGSVSRGGSLSKRNLQNSSRSRGDRIITAEVGFNTPYAYDQHENLSYKHETGQAHYLKDVANTYGEEYNKVIWKKAMDRMRESFEDSQRGRNG